MSFISDARTMPLFDSGQVIEVNLEAEFSRVFLERQQDASAYHPATLSFSDAAGSEKTMALEIRTRGRFRLDRKNCAYPPLFFRFDAADVTGTVFEGQTILPVVTQCQSTGRYRQYLLQEYLAYKVLEVLTDKSLRTRLLRIKYVNKKNARTRGNYFAFAVEYWDDMAERLNAERVEPEMFLPLEGHEYDTLLMNIYQFLIGNTDWSAVYRHNIVLIRSRTDGIVSPVPFDFDSAGVIDAMYATPAENLPIRSVRQRLYRGFCRPAEQYEPVFSRFREQRATIYEMYELQIGLRKSERNRTLRYYDMFYEMIESDEDSRLQIIDACRRPKG